MSQSKPLVLFDIDGTLLRGAGPHHKQALIDGIRQVTGLDTHLDGVPTAGMLDRDLIVAMLRTAGLSQRRIRSQLRAIMTESQSRYIASCQSDLCAFVCPGAREFVSEISARGAVLGLVSGNLSGIGWKKVELAQLRSYFSFGAFAENGLSRARLAKVAAQRAVRQKLVDKNCLITLIGDHWNDVDAAKANGFQSVGVATGLMPIEELGQRQPDFLVPTLTELDPQVLWAQS